MEQNSAGPRRSVRLREKAQVVAETKENPIPPIQVQQPRVKRKRAAEAEAPSKKRAKRPKASTKKPAAAVPSRKSGRDAATGTRQLQEQVRTGPDKNVDQPQSWHPPYTGRKGSIFYWINNQQWPEEFFQFVAKHQGDQPHRQEPGKTELQQREQTQGSTTTFLYAATHCVDFLKSMGCSLSCHEDGIVREEWDGFQSLLEQDHEAPSGTAFDEDAMRFLRDGIPSKNYVGITRMISQLVVPSAELEISRGKLGSIGLVESIYEPWDGSNSLTAEDFKIPYAEDQGNNNQREIQGDPLPMPRPDYALGFSRDAFTSEQLEKLAPFLGNNEGTSAFKGTQKMIFPFLTVELATGKETLETAGRKNAHSMARALRGVVELFKMAGRQDELHRRVLGVSIIHNDQQVQIYLHYPRIEDGKTVYYLQFLEGFDFTWEDGKNPWRSYKFVMALYEHWVPMHLERLRSAVDDLPMVNFDVSSLSRVQTDLSIQVNALVMENLPPEDDSPSRSRRGPSSCPLHW